MNAIIGAVTEGNCITQLMDALQQIDQPGYEAVGLSYTHPFQDQNQHGIHTLHRPGGLQQLRDSCDRLSVSSSTALASSCASLAGPLAGSEVQPCVTSQVAVALTGEIANYQALRQQLEMEECLFSSDQPAEVIAHLISGYLHQAMPLETACLAALAQLQGHFSLVVMFRDQPDQLFAARHHKPLVIGRSYGISYACSASHALKGLADELICLSDGDYALLHADQIQVWDRRSIPVQRPCFAALQPGQRRLAV
ncbi:MAG: hypothetical protein OIF57_13125 [Marinobacterium sp.]|nr:hypothetical protein [Marinobacterium sp.]